MENELVSIEIEVDMELLREVEKVLLPYRITPEQAVVMFLKFCANPATQKIAVDMIIRWKREQEENIS